MERRLRTLQTATGPHVLSNAGDSEAEPSGNGLGRIVGSVRRSFSLSRPPRRRRNIPDMSDYAMHSTPAEWSSAAVHTVGHDHNLRPTVSQIAMGLHISRTPHLRSTSSPTVVVPRDSLRKPRPLPPSPARSAMRKRDITPFLRDTDVSGTVVVRRPPPSDTASSSTLDMPATSLKDASPAAQGRVFSFKISRFLHPTRRLHDGSESSRPSTPNIPPKKAVRFDTPPDFGDDV
ncbi:hypothetical protein FISHEDRAFT_70418 [Fistulina hepatica ATCC 64428]|uniref:Uncharacterized protein n=1 Tax=Fistulina hepatica ATCC 64428 TaxID=1128425 RepID=A0A0D7AJI7_9AGAR|nr:hypothetical protein FISHEDRAFT_70418 [Fistulina hepatica ATCC 64428]